MDLLSSIANEFEIPIISRRQKIWFFRTKAGKYYYDFYFNKFIALGWDLISPDFIVNNRITKEKKKAIIEDKYPEEKRPGLIFSQLDVFYNEMLAGDIVIIPNEGSKTILIGELGEIIESVSRQTLPDNEYPQCSFNHKRSVRWLKTIEAWQDVYLFKALRAQQTISDLTEDADLVFRNLFPAYISDKHIHLTFQKTTSGDLNLANNIELLAKLLEIIDEVSLLYQKPSFKNEITYKTAVGSPGFFELILPCTPISVISIIFITNLLLGKIKTKDGETGSGISAIISMINVMINDHTNRKKTNAETDKIKAKTDMIKAETAKTYAEARNIDSCTELNEAQTKKTEAETELIKTQTKLALAELAHENAEVRRRDQDSEQIKIEIHNNSEEEDMESEIIVLPNTSVITTHVDSFIVKAKSACTAAHNNDLTLAGEKIRNTPSGG